MNSAAVFRPREGVSRPSSASEAINERSSRSAAAEMRSSAACSPPSGAVAKSMSAMNRFRRKSSVRQHGARRLFRLLEQETDFAAAPEKAHAALLPESRQ